MPGNGLISREVPACSEVNGTHLHKKQGNKWRFKKEKQTFRVHLAAEPLGGRIIVKLKIRLGRTSMLFFLKCTKGFSFLPENNIIQQAHFALFCCMGLRKAQGRKSSWDCSLLLEDQTQAKLFLYLVGLVLFFLSPFSCLVFILTIRGSVLLNKVFILSFLDYKRHTCSL